jgi:DNA-binding transcriptional LysR family regulator
MLMRRLSFFVTLAQEKHFKKAADLCNVTQPTLSTAIRKLEEDLGAALVVRDHRYLGLTPEGEKALAWGRQILADYDSLKDDLHGKRPERLCPRPHESIWNRFDALLGFGISFLTARAVGYRSAAPWPSGP